MSTEYKEVRVGLMGLGLEAYWNQFEGLQARLSGYLLEVERRIERPDRVIVNLGLVDTPQKALAAGHACRTHDIDLLLIYVGTYALSSTVLPVVLRAGVPIVFLNLQPSAAIDYEKLNRLGDRTAMTGEWLRYCGSCPMPEIANVLSRLGRPFRQVTGTLYGDPACWEQVEQWIRAAGVVHALAHSRLGLLGHPYSGMLDVSTDLVLLCGRFGIHVEMLEVDELSCLRLAVEESVVRAKLDAFHDFFEIGSDCSEQALSRAACTAVALDRFVEKNDLDLLAYFYKGSGIAQNEDTMSSIILGTSMLTGRGISVAGEYEIKNAVAMKILSLLGAGGSFSEFYALDFAADLVLLGHDGPGHIGMAQTKIKVRPLALYHGKVGTGLSVEMSVKHGPVTLLSVVEDREGGFKLLVAEGESIAGEILEIGNTNGRYRFAPGVRAFVEQWNAEGPAHHCAIGLGHDAPQLKKVASLLDLKFVQIC